MKVQAEKLRKDGRSYSYISRELDIPKSTLSNWFAQHEWSRRIKESLTYENKVASIERAVELNRVRGHKLKELYQQAEVKAREEFEILKYDPLFIAGLILYKLAGEKKTKNLVRVSSADHEIIKIFMMFLEKFAPGRRPSVQLMIGSGADEPNERTAWLEKLGQNVRFNKSQRVKSQKTICNLGVASVYLKIKMLIWLDLLPKAIINNYQNAGVV